MNIPLLKTADIEAKLAEKNYPAQTSYLAMYSSWLQGITTEPRYMLIPVDDHLVHRGDGVFEAIKMVKGRFFLLDEHLKRLESSAKEISLKLPYDLSKMKEIIFETTKQAKVENAVLRLYISRGPGGFTANPYDSVASQMYLIVTSLVSPAADKYAQGVLIGRSKIALKDSFFACIKTCNYLPNVLMKKESVDRKLDFTVSFDAQNFLAESSTENIVIVDKNNNLCRPFLRQILKGTTMIRTFELAQKLYEADKIAGITERDISEKDLMEAKEVMMIGTTLDILPVVKYENQTIAAGSVGPVAKALLELLRQDMAEGSKSTPLV